jgi:hypothetical protein
MDGACLNSVYNPNNLQIAPCPQYSYVISSDLQPYFDIATSYHFANYMFPTNAGPSFPAHQSILSGTSAPADPGLTGLTNYLDFVAENAGFDKSGCPDTSQHPAWVDPTGFESQQPTSQNATTTQLWGTNSKPTTSLGSITRPRPA